MKAGGGMSRSGSGNLMTPMSNT